METQWIQGQHFTAPPFDGKRKTAKLRFCWWSCWGGNTEQEAVESRRNKSGFDWISQYHNKLIREDDDGTLTEVLDSPLPH